MAKGPCRPKLRFERPRRLASSAHRIRLGAARERRRFGQSFLAAGPSRSRKRWPPKGGWHARSESGTGKSRIGRSPTAGGRPRTASIRSSIRLSPPAFSYSPGRYAASRKTATWLISSLSSPALCSSLGSFPGSCGASGGATAPTQRRGVARISTNGHPVTSSLGRAASGAGRLTVQILLPIAAVALGMAAFDIVEHFA